MIVNIVPGSALTQTCHELSQWILPVKLEGVQQVRACLECMLWLQSVLSNYMIRPPWEKHMGMEKHQPDWTH